MGFATRSREFCLVPVLFESRGAFFRQLVDTLRAGYPFAVIRRLQVIAAKRPPASVALNICTFRQVPINSDASIKYKAIADPPVVPV